MEAPRRQPLLDPTDENIAKAKAFIYRKWIEREKEIHQRDAREHAYWSKTDPAYAYAPKPYVEPTDLSSACKFSALFASVLFGGRMTGNYDHYYVSMPKGKILDLNADSKDVQEMLAAHQAGSGDDPYREDSLFTAKALRSDKRDVAKRVVEWLNQFAQETGLTLRFQKTRSGAIKRGS